MKNMRCGLIALSLLFCSVSPISAQVSIGIGLPSVSIGINLPMFPELVLVPGYPVYYAPRLDANYFFYDGMYWVFMNENWYASSWYNGPWGYVGPDVVPRYILRIPVRYYRQPPIYFRGWHSNAPPRWGQHWGPDWEKRRSGWNRWKRNSAPAAAPLPVYQRQYSGDRYPRQVEQQRTLHSRQYRYQPHDKVVRQHFKQLEEQRTPAPAQRERQHEPVMKTPQHQDRSHPAPHQKVSPAAPHSQQRQEQRAPAPVQRGSQETPSVRSPRQQDTPRPPATHQQSAPAAPQPSHQQQAPRSQGQQQKTQDRGKTQEHGQDHGQGQKNDEERGQGRNR